MLEVNVVNHPVIKHKLALLRDERTGAKVFRELVEEIAIHLTYEASRNFEIKEVSVKTPFGESSDMILEKETGIVTIFRAGLGMIPGALKVFPNAHMGHFGITRDPETLEPIQYYAKYLDEMKKNNVIVFDPMLATGGTASKAITLLKEKGASSISLVCIVSVEQGISLINKSHPDVPIFTAIIDPLLSEQGFIVPGVGDAGDRLFGTS
jgi:uracil phosphoribosyltransferase